MSDFSFNYAGEVFYDVDPIVAKNHFENWLHELRERNVEIDIVSSNMTTGNIMNEQVFIIYVAYKVYKAQE